MHMIMWAMSDRAIPRSLRMMKGFGIHTFRFISAEGKSHFVKFHWKPLLGLHAVAWDEAQKISGKTPISIARTFGKPLRRRIRALIRSIPALLIFLPLPDYHLGDLREQPRRSDAYHPRRM
jgi:hypothetical protein